MSSTVDNRVVQMKFDNKDFESNVGTSLKSLKTLNENLKMTDGTTGFNNLAKAAKGVTLDTLASSVESIQSRFSALGVIGMTALQNITNSAIETGKQMLASLTIDPIKDGFGEYELKMGSVQTIMSSTGADLQTVNGYLAELNTYADKTIYSFSDMTSSIGKFTNNGVELDKAVKAIQGISNEAALSGANAEQASHAMYNFSQALSSGAVKLIDWKSIENANMATVEFKQELIDTALRLGTLRKEGDKYVSTTTDLKGKVSEAFDATSMFNDSLSAQWMTSDVLVETLGRYADETTDLGKRAFAAAQDVKTFTQLMDTLKEAVGSGWAETFELIFGDFEEAKALWTAVNTEISGILDAQAQARNDLLRGWKELGGRNELIQAISNTWDGLLSVLRPIRDAFRDIFPATTAQQLYDATVKLRELTEHFKISDETAQNLRSTFRGLFAVLDILKQVFGFVFTAASPLLGLFGNMGGGILGVTGALGDWIYAFDLWLKKNDGFQVAAKAVASALQVIVDLVGKVFEKMKKLPGPFDENNRLLNIVATAANKVGDAFGFLYTQISKLAGFLAQSGAWNKVLEGLSVVFSELYRAGQVFGPFIVDLFKAMAKGVSSFADACNTDIIQDIISGGFLAVFIIGMRKVIKIAEDVASLKDSFIGVLDSVRETFEAYQMKLKADVLLKIAIAIGILAASLIALSLVNQEKLKTASFSMAALFAELIGTMMLFEKLISFDSIKDSVKFTVASTALIALASAAVQMAKALKLIGEMPWPQIQNGLIGLAGVTTSMIVISLSLKNNNGHFISAAISMALMAQSIKLMIKPMQELAEMASTDPKRLIAGLTALGVMMAEMAAFFKFTNKMGKIDVSSGLSIVLFAEALRLMADALNRLAIVAMIDWTALAAGFVALGGSMYVLVKAFQAFDELDNPLKTAAAVLIAAGALNLLANAISSLSTIDLLEIGKSLLAFGIAFKMVIGALNAMPEKSLTMGTSLLMIGKALNAMSIAIERLAAIEFWSLVKGMVAFTIAILEMMVALRVVSGPFALQAGAGLAIVASSLMLLAPALKMLGTLDVLHETVPALIALAGALAVICGAAMVIMITGAGAAIVALGVGIALLSSSLLIAATALLLFAKALSIIGVDGLAAAAAVGAFMYAVIELIPLLFEGIAKGIAKFVSSIKDMITSIINDIVLIIYAICDGLLEAVPKIAETVMALIEEVLKAVADHAPKIMEYLMSILLTLLHSINDHIAEIVDVLIDIIIKVINAISTRMSEIIQAAVTLIMSVFKGIVDALKGLDTTTLIQGVVGAGFIAALMMALAAIVPLIPNAMVGVLGVGMVITELALVLAAIGGLAQIPGLKWLIDEGGNFLQSVGTAIGKFVGGIVGGFAKGVSSQLPGIGKDLSDFMENAKGFIEGAKAIDASVMEGVKSLGETVLVLTAANILDGLTRWFTGGINMAQFGKELAEFAPYFRTYADTIDGINPEAVNASANAALALAELSDKMPAVGGLKDKIFGEKNLAEFGAALMEFAPYIKQYADNVVGVNPEAVQASAEAATIMADLAAKLPNSGGLAAQILGDNTLSQFGKELALFGPYIKKYAEDVAGLSAESVIASASAAQIMSDMASTLPNSGGLASVLLGDNTLSQFGYELQKFGPCIAAYAESVKDINPAVVVASALAAQSLSQLANNLPNSGGLISFFTGENDIDKFGKGLKAFGKGFGAYYREIEEIDTAQMANVTFELRKLVNLAATIANINVDNLGVFAKNLKKVASDAVQAFIKEFSSSEKKVKNAVTTFLSVAKKAISGKQKELGDEAKKVGEKVVSELENELKKTTKVTNAAVKLCTAIIDALKKNLPSTKITPIGESVAANLALGMNSSNAYTRVQNAASNLGTVAYNILKGYESSFNNAGQWMLHGLYNGLTDSTRVQSVKNAATYVGSQLLQALNEKLGIASPSKEGEKVGKYTNAGIVKGLKKTTGKVAKKGSAVGNTVKSSLGKSFTQVDDSVAVLLTKISDQLAKIIEMIEKTFKTDTFYEAGVDVTEDVASGMTGKESSDILVNASQKFSSKLKEILETQIRNDTSEYASIGEMVTKGITEGMNDNLSNDVPEIESEVAKKGASEAAAEYVKQLQSSTKKGAHEAAVEYVTQLRNTTKRGASEAAAEYIQKLQNANKKGASEVAAEYARQLQSAHKKSASQAASEYLKSGKSVAKKSASEAASQYVKQLQGATKKSASQAAAEYLNVKTSSIGKSVVEGVAKGITGNDDKLKQATTRVGKSTLNGFKTSLKIHSPSKEGEEIGKFVDLGISDGLIGFVSKVVGTAKNVGNTITNTLTKALSGVNNVIGNDYISDPVIRPVVDLSDVTNSANQIDGMFGTQRTVNLAGSVNASMNGTNKSLQNDLNEVSSAVSKLQDAVNKLRDEHGDVTNYFNISQSPGESMEEFAKYVAQYITREYNNQREVWGTA